MRHFNFICSILLAIMIPLMIVLLSANFALRIPDTYKYYFNDSEVLDEIVYDIPEKDMASAFSSYFNAINNEAFQVYEDNGYFQDPIYDSQDVKAMKQIKDVMAYTGIGSMIFLLLSLAIFIYLYRGGFKHALRNRFKVALPISIVLIILNALAFSFKTWRHWLYANFVGVKLVKDSLLVQVLGGNFFGTYVLFSTIIGSVILAIITYAIFTLTKPPRIFF